VGCIMPENILEDIINLIIVFFSLYVFYRWLLALVEEPFCGNALHAYLTTLLLEILLRTCPPTPSTAGLCAINF